MIIMKFGGTSVKDSIAMERVISIVASRRDRLPLVVLSACSGVTDKLIYLARISAVDLGVDGGVTIKEIADRHTKIIENLIHDPIIASNATANVNKLLAELRNLFEGISLLKECTRRSLDAAASFGELLSSTVFEAACLDRGLDAALVDARSVISTDSSFGSAQINRPAIKQNFKKIIEPLLTAKKVVITQGFIGSDENGHTTTLGRGGSDYSASVFGEAAGADEIQIWTDVPGVLTADPRKVPEARTIPLMSFAEVRELSFYGAKVLHPETIKPAIESNIPVRVLDSHQPEHSGTLIVASTGSKEPDLRSVILKENCRLCRADIPYNEDSQLYFAKVLRALSKSGAKILSSICTENSFQIIVDGDSRINDELFGAVVEEYKFIIEDTSLIGMCGINLLYPDDRINNIMFMSTQILTRSVPSGVVFGASSVSVIILIPNYFGQEALTSIHRLIISSENN